jgi:hypothetical protein
MHEHLVNLVSILSTIYARIFCQYFGAKNYKAEMYLEKAAQRPFLQKNAHVKC